MDQALPGADSLFELVAVQGTDDRLWGEPLPDFDLTPQADDAPAVIMIDYAGINLTIISEEPLMLHHYTGGGWEPANRTCGLDSHNDPLYKIQRFPDSYLLAIPICKTGVYALRSPVEDYSDLI